MFVALRPPAEKPRRIGFVRSRWAAVVAGQEKRRAAIRSKHASTVTTPIPKVQVSNQLPAAPITKRYAPSPPAGESGGTPKHGSQRRLVKPVDMGEMFYQADVLTALTVEEEDDGDGGVKQVKFTDAVPGKEAATGEEDDDEDSNDDGDEALLQEFVEALDVMRGCLPEQHAAITRSMCGKWYHMVATIDDSKRAARCMETGAVRGTWLLWSWCVR